MTDDKSRNISHAVLIASVAITGLWLAHLMVGAFLLSVFALSLAIALSAAVTWLEQRRCSRMVASAAVFCGVAALTGLLAWIVVPRVAEQLLDLVNDAPTYINKISSTLEPCPDFQQALRLDGGCFTCGAGGAAQIFSKRSGWTAAVSRAAPAALGFVTQVGRLSVSVIGGVILAVITTSLIIYLVVNPRPLLRAYVLALPPRHRAAGVRAFARASQMIVRWMRANLIMGALEAGAAWLALSLLNVPGALYAGS